MGPMGLPGQMAISGPPAPAPVLVFDGGAAPVSTGPNAGGVTGETPAMLGGGSNVAANEQSDTAAARSTRMADPTNTVVQGTLIPAVLETAINSDLPGYARAVVSHDIRSFDGQRVLIPRSSRLIGEYKTGLAAGQKRAYLLWTRLVRPDGVSVALASPAVDISGQAGITGKVNDHFFQRFGSAILLSIIGGASSLVSSGSTVVVGGSQNAASVAAQHDSQRPPTIRVRPGEPVRVFTARDLIFTPAAGARG
jgi:type IV secretion system protein VirB10